MRVDKTGKREAIAKEKHEVRSSTHSIGGDGSMMLYSLGSISDKDGAPVGDRLSSWKTITSWERVRRTELKSYWPEKSAYTPPRCTLKDKREKDSGEVARVSSDTP